MSMTRRRLLDDTYKKTASGNPVIARTVARMNPDLKVYGWTEQDEYAGKNLLNFSDTEQTINGMTFVVKDSVLTVSGTTNKFTTTAGKIYYMLPIVAGDYYLSQRNSGGEYVSAPKVEAWVIDADDTEHFYGNGLFSLNGTEKSCRVYFAIQNGETFSSEKFYPMINVGTSALTWEPYTGGNPAPNPEYPIPWHNAGEVMTTGAQVYDQSLAQDNLYQNYDTVNQNLAISNNPNYWISGKVPVKPNTTYSMNRKQAGGCFYSDENTPITTSVILADITFTTPENCNFVVFNFVKTSTVFGTAIMMNVGSAALPWEPYTNGVPVVNPYKGQVDVNITGRNLFDASLFTDEDLAGTLVTNNGDGSFTVADSYTEWTLMNVKKNLSDEMTRMLFHPGTLHVNFGGITYPYFEFNFFKNGRIIVRGSNDAMASVQVELTDDYFVTDNGDEIHAQFIIYADPSGETMFNPGTFRPMIYYDGNGSFEPYKEPQSLPLVLEAPLTKWDRIEQRNGVLGVVRKSAEIVMDGSEDEDFSIYERPDEGKSFSITLNDSVGGYQTSLCDKYRNINAAWNSDHKDEYVIYSDHMNVTNKTRYFRPPSAEIETIEQWKTWLQSNPLTLLYETEEETFEPFDVLQQEILNAIHTYNPSTSVFNWQNCDVDFTYKTRKSVENYE